MPMLISLCSVTLGGPLLSSWRRALDLIEEMPARPIEEEFEDFDVEWGNVNPAGEVAMPGRREPGVVFMEEGQVPVPQANKVHFHA